MNLTFHLKMGRLVIVFELSATFRFCVANAHEIDRQTDCNAQRRIYIYTRGSHIYVKMLF